MTDKTRYEGPTPSRPTIYNNSQKLKGEQFQNETYWQQLEEWRKNYLNPHVPNQ